MKMKTLGELMIPLDKYPHINHRATVGEAIDVIAKTSLDTGGLKSLPRMLLVFDDIDQLVGLLRRRDILRGLEPESLSHPAEKYRTKFFNAPEEPDPNLVEFFFERTLAGLKERALHPVTDIMVPPVAWVDYDDHISKGIFEMVNEDVSLLPVILDKRVVGVVRTVDLLQELHRMLTESEGGDD